MTSKYFADRLCLLLIFTTCTTAACEWAGKRIETMDRAKDQRKESLRETKQVFWHHVVLIDWDLIWVDWHGELGDQRMEVPLLLRGFSLRRPLRRLGRISGKVSVRRRPFASLPSSFILCHLTTGRRTCRSSYSSSNGSGELSVILNVSSNQRNQNKITESKEQRRSEKI